jgi:NAD(P)-dependent dehydrogenase (short-subunit alcohol dehydrogenase family)
MLADIEGKALDVAVAELKKGGIDARGVECDVADRAAVQRAGAETLAAFGKVHIVCSNAGVGIGGPMELITSGDWDWVIGVNLMGHVHVIQAFLPHLKAQGEGGHIVLTALVTGNVLRAWNRSLQRRQIRHRCALGNPRCKLAGTSIGVSVLCTGWVRSRIADSVRNRPERYGERTPTSPDATGQLAALIRAGMEPEEVAEKVVRTIKLARVILVGGRCLAAEHG